MSRPSASMMAILPCWWFGAAAMAADPGGAVYSAASDRIFWLMHISDTHIGSEWYQEDTRFFWALNEALGIIQPDLVINTGDLVDGSVAGIPASGQNEVEWRHYREAVDQTGLPADFYIDLPGNHDIYGSDLRFYLQWSLNGSTFGRSTRSFWLEYAFGKYFLYGCATCGDSAPPFVDTASFSQAELDEMQAELDAATDASLILVFGHHPPDGPENADRARAIWRAHGAMYFHGHVHTYDEYLHDEILVREVDSLGKSSRENLAVLAVDNNWVAYEVTDYEDPWPFIVITAPAASRLKNDFPHPYAYPVGLDCPQAPVRALVFDRSQEPAVSFSAAGGAEISMTRDPARPMLYLGTWDTRSLSAGEVTLTVTVRGSKERRRTISVRLDTVDCPEPWEPTDGGSDGGDTDGVDEPQEPDAEDGSPGEVGDELDDLSTDESSEVEDKPTDEELSSADGCGCRSVPTPEGTASLVLGFLLLRRTHKSTRRGSVRQSLTIPYHGK